jgi:hypothetical protein
VGFGPLLGEFSSKPLGVHERITQVDNEDGVIIITTSYRTLVFGSRMNRWDGFEGRDGFNLLVSTASPALHSFPHSFINQSFTQS